MSYHTQTDDEIRNEAHKGGAGVLFATLAAIGLVGYLLQSLFI